MSSPDLKESVILVFVCHDKTTTFNVLQKVPDATVIFVGDQPIDEETRAVPNLIIARELPDNIEPEKKLLTFTAWYAIIKNNLFTEYDYICILENDVLLSGTFMQDLQRETEKNEQDLITFCQGTSCFFADIKINILEDCLKIKELDFETTKSHLFKKGWYPSTNQCINREVLNKFVDWYYPFCLYIKTRHEEKFSWYHERLFSVYLHSNDAKVKLMHGLQHLSNKSHEKTFNKKDIMKMQFK
jgi:GR25 family glycosyltransferase involved in LPS biosynthesis